MGAKKTSIEQIKQVTARLLKQKSYGSTSMNDIADGCKINKASLYHHFTSKENLVISVIEEQRGYFQKHFFSFAYREDLPIQARFQQMLNGLEEYYEHEKICLMGKLALEISETIPPIKIIIIQFFTDWMQALYNLLINYMSTSEAQQLASELIAFWQGTILLKRLDKGFLKKNWLVNSFKGRFDFEQIGDIKFYETN